MIELSVISFMGPVLFFVSMMLVTGILYPLAITGIVKIAFPKQASGSLIVKNDQVIGSELIAQPFKKPQYFWPRPSASHYNAVPSAASNLPPTNPKFPKKLDDTTSASGLDPHISTEMAREQIPRIAEARRLDPKLLEAMIARSRKPYINVLLANLELDQNQIKP